MIIELTQSSQAGASDIVSQAGMSILHYNSYVINQCIIYISKLCIDTGYYYGLPALPEEPTFLLFIIELSALHNQICKQLKASDSCRARSYSALDARLLIFLLFTLES